MLVRVERGEWPFMGGRLVLHETVLNFKRPTAKRLTFEVIGLDARAFVQSMGFKELEASGIFDGVLPMIFDESGGRIVGGRLEFAARRRLARLQWRGQQGQSRDDGRDRLQRASRPALPDDGHPPRRRACRRIRDPLAIDGVALGQTGTQKIIRSLLRKIPIRLNVTINAPFRALIATAKSFNDPRTLIKDVLPRPLDEIPGITTEVRRIEERRDPDPDPSRRESRSLAATSPRKDEP